MRSSTRVCASSRSPLAESPRSKAAKVFKAWSGSTVLRSLLHAKLELQFELLGGVRGLGHLPFQHGGHPVVHVRHGARLRLRREFSHALRHAPGARRRIARREQWISRLDRGANWIQSYLPFARFRPAHGIKFRPKRPKPE